MKEKLLSVYFRGSLSFLQATVGTIHVRNVLYVSHDYDYAKLVPSLISPMQESHDASNFKAYISFKSN